MRPLHPSAVAAAQAAPVAQRVASSCPLNTRLATGVDLSFFLSAALAAAAAWVTPG
jgi:hypothetical protein